MNTFCVCSFVSLVMRIEIEKLLWCGYGGSVCGDDTAQSVGVCVFVCVCVYVQVLKQ